MEPQRQNLKTTPPLSLGGFHISEDYGFLLPNPLKELPDHYKPWMEIASKLPHLIEKHQLRTQVNKMPLLDCQFLKGYREQRLAHLVLSVITMGYVWQEGEKQPEEVLPQNLALPFAEVSRSLGVPPILAHSDLVLANWTLRNPERPLEIRNLDTIVSLPGGDSLRGFVLVTVLVEKAAVPGIKATVQAVNAIVQPNQDSLLPALQRLRLSIQDITRTLGQMHGLQRQNSCLHTSLAICNGLLLLHSGAHIRNPSWLESKVHILIAPPDYVDPDIFYAVIRIFLSGWKDNPAMPVGLIYEGVSKEPLEYSGGSAAQSTVLHAFDELLGVRHSKESADFLHRMRDYMPPSHKAFIEEIHSAPSLRDYVQSSGNGQLLTSYNQCLEALAELRNYHITVVAKYIITAAVKAKNRRSSHLPGPPQALEDRGTGGSAVLNFLKNVRDKTLDAILHQSV